MIEQWGDSINLETTIRRNVSRIYQKSKPRDCKFTRIGVAYAKSAAVP